MAMSTQVPADVFPDRAFGVPPDLSEPLVEELFDLPSGLRLDLRRSALISIRGSSGHTYRARVWTPASTGEEPYPYTPPAVSVGDLPRCLRQILEAPAGATPLYLDVEAPQDRPVDVSTHGAAVEICEIDATVSVSAAGGHVALRDSRRDTRAVAKDGGTIVWSGATGSVDLEADLGMHLRVTSVSGALDLVARCDGPVALHVPRELQASVAIDVADASKLQAPESYGRSMAPLLEAGRVRWGPPPDRASIRVRSDAGIVWLRLE